MECSIAAFKADWRILNHIGARVTDMDPLPSGIAGYAMYVHIHTYTCTHKYAMFNAEIDHMAAVVVTGGRANRFWKLKQ